MKNIIILFICFFSIQLSAQNITGKVTDSQNKNALSGAAIAIDGRLISKTNDAGNFTIPCPVGKEITVSFVGYISTKQTIKNCGEEILITLNANENNLNDVEITATSAEKKSILYQPSSITKLTATELKRGTGLFLDDAINANVPGVVMQRRAVSSGQQFNIRGYGNGSRGTRGISSNFDGQGYKVYLNGIPVTDAEGITTMDDLDFGSIGNVEVAKGPAGTFYGLAIAGAVNLSTAKPDPGTTTIGQDLMVGKYGLQRYTTHFSTATDKASVLVNYGNQKSDGFMLHTASHKDFVNVAADFHPNDKQSITAYFGFSNSYDERGGELTISQYLNKDYSGNVEYIKRNGHSHVTTFRAGVGHTYHFCKNFYNTTTVFGTGFTSDVSSAGGWSDKNTINYGLRSTFNTQFDLQNGIKLSGITGIETQRQNAQTIGYGMVKNPTDTSTITAWNLSYPYWIIGANTSNLSAVEATTSLFTEWTLALPKDLSITAGIGTSNMNILLDDRFYETAKPNKTTHYEKSYTGLVSPHIAINKVFNKQFSVYASYSVAYKAPVSSYFFIPYALTGTAQISGTGVVNTTLKPEMGAQFEIGTKGVLLNNKLSYEMAYFNAIFSDKMTTVAVPLASNPASTAYIYMTNGGKQNHKGFEALVKYTAYQSNIGFLTLIKPFANLAYSDFKYENFLYAPNVVASNAANIDFSGLNVFGVPKVAANAGVDFSTKYFYGNFSYLYKDGFNIGYETVSGVNILRTTTSYSLLNAKIGSRFTLGKHVDADVFFGIDNINGTQYPLMVFVNQIPDAYMAGPLNANSYGGINLKYHF